MVLASFGGLYEESWKSNNFLSKLFPKAVLKIIYFSRRRNGILIIVGCSIVCGHFFLGSWNQGQSQVLSEGAGPEYFQHTTTTRHLTCNSMLYECLNSTEFSVQKRGDLFPNSIDPNKAPSYANLSNALVHLYSGRIRIKQRKTMTIFQPWQCESTVDARWHKRLQHKLRLSPNIPAYAQCIHLTGLWSYDFYHNLIEQVPRLTLVLDLLRSDLSLRIIGQPQLRPWLQDLYQIPPDRIVSRDAFCKTLLVPESVPCGNMSSVPLILDKFRENIPFFNQQDETPPSAKVPLVLLIRRRKTRVIQNHNQLLKALQAVGNITVSVYDEKNLPPPGLPQLARFANASLIVAPHGAGLSCMVAASTPTMKILEIHPTKSNQNMCFSNLARAMGLTYQKQAMIAYSKRKQRGTVDVPKVVANVVSMLNLK